MSNTFTVISSADDVNVSDGSLGTATGNGNDSSGTLRQAINYANATQGPVTINIAAGLSPIVLSGALQPILNSVTINGNGEDIEGNGTRLFFIGVDAADEVAGTNFADRIVVNLGDLTLSGGLAQGGAGSGEAGGGLGAGGAIFINQAADVTLTDVTLVNDKAIGGAGGTGSFAGGAGGLGGDGGGYGGGGLYGAGSEGAGGGVFGAGGGSGGGGGGYSGDGGARNTAGTNGTLELFGLTGSAGGGPNGTGGSDGGGGGGDNGGGGGGFGGLPRNGGFGGGGGDYGGAGGFGGGGGGGTGGNGGFGGGGAFAGNGGFGGGGGGSGYGAISGTGGFGGGGGAGSISGFGATAATGSVAGNGAGLGGAIFVAAGGSLEIDGNSVESGGSAIQGGTGHVAGFGAGIFDEGGTADTPNVLTFGGTGVQSIDDAIADLNGAGGTSASNGLGRIGGTTSLEKTGVGTLILSGTDTYTGTTEISAGTLLVNGSIAASATTVGNGAVLGGSGTVGVVTVASGGFLSPGNSPGQLNTGNLNLAPSATYVEQIGGITAGNGYDQTNVTGTVNLNSANLSIQLYSGFKPSFGQTYTIINNDSSDAVTGTFSGLSEGSSVAAGGYSFAISYSGGDGNDVTLTTLAPVTAPTGLAQKPGTTTTSPGTVEITGATTDAVGDTVNLYADGGTTVVGTGTVQSNGTFDITTTATFTDGAHSFTATDTSANGISSGQSAAVTAVVSPVTPTGLAQKPGTTTTSPGTVEITGATTDAVGDTVNLYADGGTTVVGTGMVQSNGTFDITTTATFTDGAHSFTATDTSANGISSGQSAAVTAVVSPVTPTGLAQKPGTTTTSPGTVEITGATTDAVGDTVNLYADGGTTVVGTGTVQSNGTFDITTTATFTDGAHSFTATDTSANGISSGQSAAVTAVVSPVTPTGLAQKPGTTTTSPGTVEITGATTDAVGDTVNLYADGGTTVVGTGMVQSNGTFDITTTATFTDGAHSFTATDTSANGISSGQSAAVTAVVSPAAATAVLSPTTTTAIVNPATATAVVNPMMPTGLAQKPGTTTTSPGTVEITGATTDAVGDTVNLYADGGTTVVGTGMVQSNGTFDITTTATFTDGAHSFTATDTSANGISSGQSAAVTAVVSPVTPTGLAQKPGTTTTSPGTVEITGATTDAVGDTVNLYADGGTTVVGTGTVQSNGTFDITTTATFTDGTHSFTATDVSNDGIVSGHSIAAIAVVNPVDTVSIDPYASYNHGVFTLLGTATSAAGVASVEISALVDGMRQDLGTAALNQDGTFTFADQVADQQTFFVATLTEVAGAQATSADPGFILTGGLGPHQKIGKEESFDSTSWVSTSFFKVNGQRSFNVEAPDTTVLLQPFDIVANHQRAGTSFVFNPGDGVDVIHGFQLEGAGHDTLGLPSADFQNLADVLRHTLDVGGGTTITDPKTGDAIGLAGVTAAELKTHHRDISFHG